ncbi:MAG: hypothetical protein F4Y61_07445 [Rhodothermaceae bacterium]|nr:hypothetical protein [Rhodothermaceae bacterium]
MPKVKKAILALEAKELEKYAAGESLTITGDGFQLDLQPGDIEIVTEGIKGWLVGQEGGFTVAMDTVITEELLHEGLVRESINRLQNLRKAAKFNVTDRIHIEYNATDVLSRAIERYAEHVRNETLAVTLESVKSPTGERVERFSIGEQLLTIGVSRLM